MEESALHKHQTTASINANVYWDSTDKIVHVSENLNLCVSYFSTLVESLNSDRNFPLKK